MAVSGNEATWDNGEQMRINGTVATINRIDGHYYIDASAVNQSGTNRALYPATLSDGPIAADVATINLPQQYRYNASDGLQHIELPMAARNEGLNPLPFRHLTGALRFNIVNNLGTTIVLDRLTVESDHYSLSGSRTIDFSAIEATAPATPAQDTDRTVVLVFASQYLATGDSLQVTIPIAPVGADNHFTVSLSARHEGTRYTFSRRQTTGGALTRNQLGHATTPLASTTTSQGPLFDKIGSGTAPYNFTISTPEEFVLMVDAINNSWNYSGKTYKTQKYTITDDIDMSGHPISQISGFSGLDFDGGNHTVSNLTISGSDGHCGLFKTIGAVAVHDLTLNNTTLNYTGTGELHIAPLAADINGNATISNCNVNTVNFATPGNANTSYSGLIGYCSSNCTIQSCDIVTSAEISHTDGTIFFGGIIGFCDGNNTIRIESCNVENANIDIEGTTTLLFGGLVGRSNNTTLYISNSGWTGNNIQLNTTATLYAGGLAGRLSGSNTTIVPSSCSASGTYHTDSETNGFAIFLGKGISGINSNTFSNCTGSATVNGDTITNNFN